MMHLNLFHRTDAGEKYTVFRQQQDLVHGLGLKATIFIQYSELFDETAIRDVLADARDHGDEIGLGLHRMNGPGMDELVHGNNSFWLFPRDRKREVLARILARYREVFGRGPVSVACYHLDASSLAVLRELSPETGVVVGGCFEEGVRVYHGCNNSWYLFNEGMPWNPWYPSKTHALRPARDEADAAGVIAVPHLLRDMSLAYEDRDDFWASHPPNVMRGLGNLGGYCPYDLNLIDQYRMQERFNGGYSYYNSFVGAGWLVYNKNLEVPPAVAWDLYRKFLAYLVELKSRGEVQDLTLGEYAAWFREHRPLGRTEPEVYWAKEMLYGSGKHYLWYADADQRVLIDTHQGGSIGDLRPYLGQVPVSTGPDTPHRDMGSYPYLIQSQHRTGYSTHHRDGSRATLYVTHAGQTIDLATRPAKCRSLERKDGRVVATLTPVDVTFQDGLTIEIETVFSFHPGGRLHVSRSLARSSDPSAAVTVRECFKACHGFTEYPEDLHDIRLILDAEGRHELPFDYLGRVVRKEHPASARAVVPALNLEVELRPDGDGALRGEIEEGYLFNPYFALSLEYALTPARRAQSWLILNRTK